MKERIHEQISHELKEAARLDKTIVIIDIVVSLILFSLSMGFAYSSTESIYGGLTGTRVSHLSVAPTIIMFVALATILAINWFSVRAFLKSKKQIAKQTDAIVKLYKDENMDQYYDGSISKSYETRYNLFAVIVAVVGAMSIIIPLVIFINQVTKL